MNDEIAVPKSVLLSWYVPIVAWLRFWQLTLVYDGVKNSPGPLLPSHQAEKAGIRRLLYPLEPGTLDDLVSVRLAARSQGTV